MTDPTRYTTWRPITCPKCGSRAVRITKTMPVDGFGYQDRYCVCKGCVWRFIATTEPEDETLPHSTVWKTTHTDTGE